MNILLIILGALLLVGGLLWYFAETGQKLADTEALKARMLFEDIERKYVGICESVLKQSGNIKDKGQVLHQSMIILKPQIEALLALMLKTGSLAPRINYYSSTFGNSIMLAEAYFEIISKRKEKNFTEQEIEHFYQTFEHAIESDLMLRLMKNTSS